MTAVTEWDIYKLKLTVGKKDNIDLYIFERTTIKILGIFFLMTITIVSILANTVIPLHLNKEY